MSKNTDTTNPRSPAFGAEIGIPPGAVDNDVEVGIGPDAEVAVPPDALDDVFRSGTWHLNGNGYVGELVIEIAGDGQVTGSAYGNPIVGLWSEHSAKLTFMRLINPLDPSSFQFFTGYFFADDSHKKYLAGSFDANQAGGGTPDRQTYGWFATR